MGTNATVAADAGTRALLMGRSGGRGYEGLTLVRARGSLVWDADGREYLDCTAQAWSNNLGANDPRVVEAAIEQLRAITHVRPVYTSMPLLELSAKLVEIAPAGLDRVGYSCTAAPRWRPRSSWHCAIARAPGTCSSSRTPITAAA